MRTTATLLLTICFGTAACDGEHPPLDPDEARGALTAYHIEASGGAYGDTAGLEIRFRGGTADRVRAVGAAGKPLATFRWMGDGWRMDPDPRLAARLERLKHDRSEVEALGGRVDSAESNLASFERELRTILRNARDARPGSGPWQWRLGRAEEFLEEMEVYLERLRRRSRRTAGADGIVNRLEGLLRRVQEARGRLDRALSASGDDAG